MVSDSAQIIVIGRDDELVQRIDALFPKEKAALHRESSIDRVVERCEADLYDVLVITSAAFKAGELDGIELLEVIAAESPMTQVLFLAAPRDIQLAMSALRAGTYQYAKLPVSDQELRLLIEAAVEKSSEFDRSLLAHRTERKSKLQNLIGKSPAMQMAYRLIRQAAATDIPVLLTGETGTGKDLAGQAIHQLGARAEAPYVPVNLGAVPRELVASELFGHMKGAFTGATEPRQGRFEEAHDGTIFLDEISSIDEKVQVSLLRLIEQKSFRRLGGKRTISTDARLIVATNEDLAEAVERGLFRQDLFYRLDVFRIDLPPLRRREGDILLLIDEFLKRYSAAFEKSVGGISPECGNLLQNYDWPGNVRELKNVIQRAVLVCQGDIVLPEHLPPRFRPDHAARPKVTFEVGTSLDDVEREMILRTLSAVHNNKKRAAELLGIGRRTLYSKLEKYGIESQ